MFRCTEISDIEKRDQIFYVLHFRTFYVFLNSLGNIISQSKKRESIHRFGATQSRQIRENPNTSLSKATMTSQSTQHPKFRVLGMHRSHPLSLATFNRRHTYLLGRILIACTSSSASASSHSLLMLPFTLSRRFSPRTRPSRQR